MYVRRELGIIVEISIGPIVGSSEILQDNDPEINSYKEMLFNAIHTS